MAGQIGIRGRNNKRDIPDCPACGKSLKFDYLGKILDYCNGYKTMLVCEKCKTSHCCQDGKIIDAPIV